MHVRDFAAIVAIVGAAIVAAFAIVSAPASTPASAYAPPAGITADAPIGTAPATVASTHPASSGQLRSLLRAIVAGQTIGIDGRAYAARVVTQCGHPRAEHNFGPSGLTWSYVFPAVARYFGISRCSVVLSGHGHSVIVASPSGRIVTRS